MILQSKATIGSFLLGAISWTLAGAQQAVDARKAIEEAAAAQTRAASAMGDALDKQRAAVQTQTRTADRTGFFVLSPPAAMGAPPAPEPAEPDCDALPRDRLDALLVDAARREGLEVDLLRAVMRQESGFRPCAVSPKGAIGLMQLMPATAAELGVANPFDPVENLAGGARLLKQLLKRYNGDRELALGAYNAGPAAVDAAGGTPPYPETIDYIRRILLLPPIRR